MTQPAPAGMKARLQGARVLVVGDAMLDRYWFGSVERIFQPRQRRTQLELTEHLAQLRAIAQRHVAADQRGLHSQRPDQRVPRTGALIEHKQWWDVDPHGSGATA